MEDKSWVCAVCDPEEEHPDIDFCSNCNADTRYIVWSSIEQVLDDSDLYQEVVGTTRSLRSFDNLADAHRYQSNLVKDRVV